MWAGRSLISRKLFTALNLIGLSIAMLAFALIMLFIADESKFDNFHSKGEHIYRVTSATKERLGGVTPYIWGKYLEEQFPEIMNHVAFQILTLTTRKDNLVYSEQNIITADSTFFEIFDFPVISGDRNDLLKYPDKIIITPETACRYFQDQNPVGKIIEINIYGNFIDFEVAGVVQCPANSHLQFDFIIPIELIKKYSKNSWAYDHWRMHFAYTYVLLSQNSNVQNVRLKFREFLERNAGQEVSSTYAIDLQPLRDIYQNPEITFDFRPRGNKRNVRILKLIAIGILFIGLINFTNLSTAQSFKRANEIAIKKVHGSSRLGIILQLLGESCFLSGIATMVTITITILVLPQFNTYTGKEISIFTVLDPVNLIIACGLSLALGLLGGLYPAVLISSFRPLQILSGMRLHAGGSHLRKLLVVLQFFIATVLLIATGVIYQQVKFMSEKDPGFARDQIIAIEDGGEVSSQPGRIELLRQELSNLTAVRSITAASSFPGKQTWALRYTPDGSGTDENYSLSTIFADHDFLKTFGVEIIAGRDFNADSDSDSTAFLINESALNLFSSIDPSWADDPLRKEIFSHLTQRKDRVIGIFRDFNFESLKSNINPLIIQMIPEHFSSVQINLAPAKVQLTLREIETMWKRHFPSVPFQYSFVEEEFAKFAHSEKRLGKLLAFFSLIAIMVAILGLFGLASFLAIEKSHEMAVRKVVGASEWQLFKLLAGIFLKLVLFSNILALPTAYLVMSTWLDGFAYHQKISSEVMCASSLIILVVSLLTVSYHSLKASLCNPAQILTE